MQENNLPENFYMPTKIIKGVNCIVENSSLLSRLGEKCLIVTGKKSSKLNGSLEDVIFALDKENIKYKIFDEIEENPSIETVERAKLENIDENIDFIFAVGGGSSIDAAKAISILFANPNITIREAFRLKNLENIPIVCAPTTSGTGSEVTQYSIITDHENKLKRNLGQETFPKIAYLDARYSLNLPVDITVSTAFDAFSHLTESYLNTNATIFTDFVAEKGFEIFGSLKESFEKKELDIADREKLMLASTLAGIAIAQTGTSLPHLLGYSLTYNKNMSHGMSNAVLYKGYLALFKEYVKIEKMLKLLGFSSIEELIDYISSKLSYSLNLTEEEIKSFTATALKNQEKLRNHPLDIDKENIARMFKEAIRS